MTGHFLISAESNFSAAHRLPGVPSCDRLHGHNWRVRVTVCVDSDGLDDTGMGVDFRVLEGLAREAVSDFEHHYLNELPPFSDAPPTAERIARIICDRVGEGLVGVAPDSRVTEVELWEMPQYRVVYRPE
jgi:6-pyruvoyltetrahydropterin/6-carboxytetrahydropterin synthase